MSIANKLYDPASGTVVFRDSITGEVLTPTQVASIVPCATTMVEATDTCYQENNNTDPTAVIEGGKKVCTFSTTYNADGSIDATSLVSTQLFSADGDDITATHEAAPCPADMIPTGEVCYTA